MIITELVKFLFQAVFKFIDGKLTLTDVHVKSSVEEIRKHTECDFEIAQ